MRKFLLTTLSLALFAFVTSQNSPAIAQNRTCDLRLTVMEMNEDLSAEIKPITDARAVATKKGSRKMIPALMINGQPQFPKLNEGEYKLNVSKQGFKRTVQEINLLCVKPDEDALLYVRLEHGSSALTNVFEKLTVRAGGIIIGRRDETVLTGGPIGVNPKGETTKGKPASSSKPVLISGGVLDGKAIRKPTPVYPPIAKAAKATGTVVVQIVVDEEGNVTEAAAVSGHPLFRAAAKQAALRAKFSPTLLEGQPVKVSGTLTYNFVLK